jgi:tryptophanyl-tRNA synthetase
LPNISATKRVLSGMRPTGRLHIGHYFGALQNWVKLQNDPAYDCFYFVADWHALTSDYADTSSIAENVLQITIDYLASGLDPAKSVIFQQSQIIEHAELHLLLSMITPLGWLERIPTYKEALENIQSKDLHTYGFLGYPTLQTADIVMYSDPGKSLFVPVGEDQVSHVEFSRELVRRFNGFYGVFIKPTVWMEPPVLLNILSALKIPFPIFAPDLDRRRPNDQERESLEKLIRARVAESGIENLIARFGAGVFSFEPILTEPDVLLTPTPRIPGLDGRKMSKSYGNAITLSESDAAAIPGILTSAPSTTGTNSFPRPNAIPAASNGSAMAVRPPPLAASSAKRPWPTISSNGSNPSAPVARNTNSIPSAPWKSWTPAQAKPTSLQSKPWSESAKPSLAGTANAENSPPNL